MYGIYALYTINSSNMTFTLTSSSNVPNSGWTSIKIYLNQSNASGSPDLTLKLHEEFAIHRRNNEYDKWFINNLLLSDYKRVSINCISWFGSLFQKQIVKNTKYVDEEQYYSVEVPKMLKKPNIICGNALCLHFAFFTQRIPNSKNEILDDKLHALLE